MSQPPEASSPQAEGTAWVDAIADLADGPHDIKALMDQGMMAQPQGDLEAAFTQFTWAAQAHPLDFWPQDALLELHLKRADWPPATTLATTILASRPPARGGSPLAGSTPSL